MAHLYKLAIRGIRSFSDRDDHIITFTSPLTVIVGMNGSGKTTLIEALKYATTGDMPPNTKGGAFVHDPKMAGQPEVRASVRLTFFNKAQEKFLVERHLMVTVKKGGGLTMKTLEGVLVKHDPHNTTGKNRTTLSSKCSELDELLPLELNVSKAILENVIFCHQEESNWPLGEPASLKKKFDDIFEATKYTRALANVKDLRKERMMQYKLDDKELQALRVDCDRADNLARKKTLLQQTLVEKEGHLARLTSEIDKVSAANHKIAEESAKFREILLALETLEEKLKLNKANQQSIREAMETLPDSDEELKRRKAGFDAHLDGLRSSIDEKRNELQGMRHALNKVDHELQTTIQGRGAMQQRIQSVQAAIESRQKKIQATSKALDLRGYDVDQMTDEQVKEFLKELDQAVRSSAEELEAEQERSKAELEKFENEISNIRELIKVQESTRKTHEASREKFVERIRRLQSNIEDIQVSQETVDRAVELEKQAKEKHEHLQRQLHEANHEARIRDCGSEMRAAEDELAILHDRIRLFNKSADTRARIDLKRQDALVRRDTVQDLAATHNPNFVRYTSAGALDTEAQRNVRAAISRVEEAFKEAECQDSQKSKALQQITSELSLHRRSQATLQEDVQQKKAELTSAIQALEEEPSEFSSGLEAAIADLQTEINQRVETLEQAEGRKAFFRELLGSVRSKGPCIACSRAIDPTDVAEIEQFVQGKVDALQRMVADQDSSKESIEMWRGTLNGLEKLRPKQTLITRIESELAELNKLIERDEEQRQTAMKEAATTRTALDDARAELDRVAKLRTVLSEINSEKDAATALDREVASLESELQTFGSTESVAEVQVKVDELTAKMRKTQQTVSALHKERGDLMHQINGLESEVNKAAMRVADKTRELNQRTALEAQREEMQKEAENAKQEMNTAADNLTAQQAPLRNATRSRQEAVQAKETNERRLRAKVDERRVAQASLLETDKAVRSLQRQGLDEQLKVLEGKLAKSEDSQKESKSKIAAAEQEIAGIDKQLNEAKASERNIADNLRYRELGRQIADLQQQIQSNNIEDAERSRQHYQNQYKESREHESKLNGEAAHTRGEMESIKSQIKAREQELHDDYRGVKEKFKERSVMQKLDAKANADLEKLAKSIESGIMKFHSVKMEEINSNINHLWAKTYQGTDVDKIMIKAEAESKGARSYNYRVTMIKNGAEMDMRGRCSAGQKVLASIIIRLALADSFSVDCSILALDEPTTNLDKDNIEALAKSLAELVNERQQLQGKSQLILITHDESFISRLGENDVLEWYFRVERDSHGMSIIKRDRVA